MLPVSDILRLRTAVISEARTWMHTPFHHQSRKKGSRGGVDCLGLVWGVGENTKVMDPISDTDAAPFWRYYGRRPNPPKMRECLSKFLVELPKDIIPLPGDIAWMHWGNQMPIHMALIGETAGRDTLIHSVWNMGVMEHTLAPEYRRRVRSYWRYPKIDEVMA